MATSVKHHAFVEVCEKDPMGLGELLHSAYKLRLPASGGVFRSGKATFGVLKSVDVLPDLVLYPPDAEPPDVPVVIVQVQLGIAAEKRESWPFYQALARWVHKRDAIVVVVTPDPKVVAWAKPPIVFGQGKSLVEVFVLGPEEIPAIVDPVIAEAHPVIAVLSAMVHARGLESLPVVKNGITGLERGGFRAETKRILYDQIVSNLNEPARRAIEAWMDTEKYEYKTEWLRDSEAKGLERGLEKGLEKGLTKGLAKAVLAVLAEKTISLTHEQQETIESCTDEARLLGWLKRAATTDSVRGIFDA